MPLVAKKIWNTLRVAFFMLRKGMSKRKLLRDLNLMKKRSKLTGKPFVTHHPLFDVTREYEFSCSNTPLYRHYFPKRKNHHYYYVDNEAVDLEAVTKVLDMMVSNEVVATSPAFSGFGFGFERSSVPVRQIRVTDSPFPMQYLDQEDIRVDQKAEEFIHKFYSQLMLQNC